ncbi:MAG: hypothetical protein HY537_10770 [Deltaproteobacteria bacterium]|nr:hypothetical protein [Deltaproteobacteria bacterium]
MKFTFLKILLLVFLVGCIKEHTPTKEISSFLSSEFSTLRSNRLAAVVIDSMTYRKLQKETKRFVADINRDTGFDVALKVLPVNASLAVVKNYLKRLYFLKHKVLEAVIFVGDIPTANYYPGLLATVVPSDSYYYDMYDQCVYDQTHQAFDSRNKFCNPIVLPFVISRLTPPVKGEEGIQYLKNYFKKNHYFRTGLLSFDEKALLYPQVLNDEPVQQRPQTLASILDKFRFLYAINALPIYDEDNELIVADWEQTEAQAAPNENYLEELSGHHQYAYVHAHGSPQEHQYNVNKTTLTTPNVFYADFYSCNVGKFTERDYIAGYYLFRGNTLFVRASSDYLFEFNDSVEPKTLFLLKQGQQIVETIKSRSPSFVIHNFGDPTLKMPQGTVQKRSTSKISLNLNTIDFKKVKVCRDIIRSGGHYYCQDALRMKRVTLTIRNAGTETLGFLMSDVPDYSLELIRNSLPPQGFLGPYVITIDNASSGEASGSTEPPVPVDPGSNSIEPGQERQFTLTLFGLVSGKYSGKIVIYNTDPRSPLMKIPFNVVVED